MNTPTLSLLDDELLQIQSAALDAAANAIVITDHNATIKWVNVAFTLLTGFSSVEAIGKNPRQLVRSGQHPVSFYKKMWDTILAGQVWHGEMINKRKDGQIYYEEQTITPLRNQEGQIRHFIAIKQDITSRKQLEKDLRQWADAFTHCAHGIAMGNPETNRILICNPAFARLHDCTVEDLIDAPILSLYAASDHEMIKNHIKTSDQVGQVEFEIDMMRRDGSSFPVQMDLVSVRDERGRLLYRVVTMQDISKRKNAEQALLHEIQESKHRAQKLETIASVSSSMRQGQTRSEMSEIVIQNMVTFLNAQFASIAFLDENRFIFETALGSRQVWRKQSLSIDDPLINEIIQSRKPYRLKCLDPEVQKNLPDWVIEALPPQGTLMLYPLTNKQNTIGLIALGFSLHNLLSPEQVNLAATIAEMGGNAINRMLATEELERMVERRERELEYIYQITSAASKSLDIRQTLQQALSITLAAVHSEIGSLYLLTGANGQPQRIVSQSPEQDTSGLYEPQLFQEIVASVIRNKQTIISSENESEHLQNQKPGHKGSLHHGSYVGLPMRIQDRLIGVLVIGKSSEKRIIVEELTLLSFIADHLALVVENTHLYEKAERFAVSEERLRLGRELHDSVTQSLFSVNLFAAGAQRYATQGNYPEVDTYLSQIVQLTLQALKDMRLLVYELRSSELTENGLLGALQNRLDAVERRSGMKVEFESNSIPPLSERIEENLYRIAIEALNNSLKHAQATHLWIQLRRIDNRLELTIKDDGCGFDMESANGQGGIGLASMRERAGLIAAEIIIRANPHQGTHIFISLPLEVEYRDEYEGENH